jgi:hypothetical protein
MVTMLGWLSMATKRDRGFQRARPKLSPSCGEPSRFFAMEILCERANLNAAQNSLTMNVDQVMGHRAERYPVSEEAVRVLRLALERGGGQLAQFSHPELGVYGQWMLGMAQIGDMFNYELRDRVERLCQELSDPSHGEHEPMLALFPKGLQL